MEIVAVVGVVAVLGFIAWRVVKSRNSSGGSGTGGGSIPKPGPDQKK